MKRSAKRPGFSIHRLVMLVLSTVVVAGLFCAAFAQCSYTTRGDAAMYFGQMVKIRDGYVSQNMEALRSRDAGTETPGHVEFGTEAGYAFLMYAVDKTLGHRAAFHLNGVLLPLMVLSLAWFLRVAAGDRRRGWLAGLFFVFFLVVPYISRREAMHLCKLLRDPTSHMLGFIALTTAVLAVRSFRRESGLALAAGIALGLSAWFRLTGILFGLPTGMYLLLEPSRRRFGRRLSSCVLLGLGVLLGMTPLIGQNVLEGKSLLETGQISVLLNLDSFLGQEGEPDNGEDADVPEDAEDADAPEEAEDAEREQETLPDEDDPASDERAERLAYARKIDKLPEGFHPVYFRMWFPRMLKRSVGAFGPRNALTVLLFAIASLVFVRRHSVLLLSTALMLIVFYSFYDKILWRYLYLGSVLTAAAASLGAVALADRALKTVRHSRMRAAASIVLVALLAVPLLKTLYEEGRDVAELDARWQRTRQVRDEMRNNFLPTDVFITYDQNFRRWLDFLAENSGSARKWGTKERRASRKALFDDILEQGERRIFFLSKIGSGDIEQPSWWKDDLLNEYDMASIGPRFRGKFMCYRLQERDKHTRTVPLSTFHPGDDHFFLFSRKLSGANRWQAVHVSAPGSTTKVPARIQAGPNLLPLPPDFDATRPSVVLSSEEVLPSAVSAGTVGAEPARMLWCSYQNMPSLKEAGPDLSIRWFGYKRWKRDWGGYDRKHMSYPLWQMPPGSHFRIPRCGEDMVVRLYFSAYHLGDYTPQAEESLPADLKSVRYRLGSAELVPELAVMRSTEKRRAWGAVEYVHELIIPASVSGKASEPDLEVHYKGMLDWDLLLYQVEFMIGSAAPPAPVAPLIRPDAGAVARAWRTDEDRSVWGRGGWLDTSFRALDRPRQVALGSAFDAPAVAAVFYWPSGRKTDRCVVSIDAGVEPTISCALSPRDDLQAFLVPLPPGSAEPSLRLIPEYNEPPGSLPVLNFVLPADAPRPGAPAVMTMDPAEDVSVLADGFWAPEIQPDGSYLAWTKGKATLPFPIVEMPRSLRATVSVHGGPQPAGTVPMKFVVNGREIGAVGVKPEEEQSFGFDVPAGVVWPGMNRAQIVCNAWRPCDVTKSEDTRELGVWLRSVELAVD